MDKSVEFFRQRPGQSALLGRYTATAAELQEIITHEKKPARHSKTRSHDWYI
jgi:hypothetical protein